MAAKRPERYKPLKPIPVAFVGANARFSGEIIDISSNGILVRCSKNLEPGTVGRLGFELGQEIFRVVVTVRRKVPAVGLAFEYMQMSPNDRQLLRRLLFRLSKQTSG